MSLLRRLRRRRGGRLLILLLMEVRRHGLGRRRGRRGWRVAVPGRVVVVLLVDAAGSEHEPVHAHAQVLSLRLEALPHEHAGAALPRDFAAVRSDVVTVVLG